MNGSVCDLDISDGEITACVEGSEDYRVEIQMTDGIPDEMWCDCPYADSGENCKHMAAVLFAAERDAYTFETSESEDECEPWEEALESLSLEQLRTLVHELALNDGKLQNRLARMAEIVVESETPLDWKTEIMEMVWEVADEEDDYIDYEHAYDLMTDIAEYLEMKLQPLMQRGAVMEAFELVSTVYTAVMELEMDDSDGGLSVVVSYCADGWREVFAAANDVQKRSMHQDFWVTQGLREWTYGTRELADIFLSLEWSEELQREFEEN